MKRKLLFSSVAVFLLLFLGYGCSDDSLSDRDIQRMIDNSLDGQWKVVNVKINGGDWGWEENNVEGYHFVDVELPELTDRIFDEGAVIGYYKFNNDTKTALPYVKTIIGNDGVPFTETYSCDFMLGNPSKARFYLESSDIGRYDNPPSAEFQIVLIY